MSNQKLLIILVGIILGSLLVLILAAYKSKQIKQKNPWKKKAIHRGLLNKMYLYFSHLWLTKKYILRIRSRIEMLEISDNWTVEKKTMRFALIAMGGTTVLFAGLLVLKAELYYLAISGLTLFIVHNQILKILVERIDHKLLSQFENFLEDVRHHFHEHGMIDEAIYDTIENGDYEMSLHANRMYEVLTAQNGEDALQEYYDLVPNKFFKTFLALCVTVIKYGDQLVDEKSMFLLNLNYLKQEINLEYLKRRQITYLFKSLSLIAIMPIFSLPMIEKWAKFNLPELAIYYQGAYGFIVQIALFLLVGISYELINRMQSNQEEHHVFQDRIETTLLRSRWISKFIKERIKSEYSKTCQIKKLLKMVGAKTTIDMFCLKRFLWLLFGVVLSVSVFLYGHEITKRNILENDAPSKVRVEQIDQKAFQIHNELVNGYVKLFKGKEVDFQVIQEKIILDNQSLQQGEVDILARKILEKKEALEEQIFQWWELLLSVLVGMVFYQIPYLILLFRRRVLQMSMEDEVMQFHTIILMLMNISRMSVEELLEWMGLFASIFKTSIEECLNNFEHGDNEALETLKNEEAFVPFVRIIENLQAATDRLPIQQVFDELKIERGYYQEKRKQDNEMMVQKKGIWGKLIAFTPMGVTMVFYLIYPFIHMSVTQFMNYSEQIKNYL